MLATVRKTGDSYYIAIADPKGILNCCAGKAVVIIGSLEYRGRIRKEGLGYIVYVYKSYIDYYIKQLAQTGRTVSVSVKCQPCVGNK